MIVSYHIFVSGMGVLQDLQLANLTAENLETTGTADLAIGTDLKTAVLATAVRRRETTIVLSDYYMS